MTGFMVRKFAPHGDWDYKWNYGAGTEQRAVAIAYGNFMFGAVTESIGISANGAQFAVGVAQYVACTFGVSGACVGVEGSPITFEYPYFDQPWDAAAIKRGWEYQKAVEKGCIK